MLKIYELKTLASSSAVIRNICEVSNKKNNNLAVLHRYLLVPMDTMIERRTKGKAYLLPAILLTFKKN